MCSTEIISIIIVVSNVAKDSMPSIPPNQGPRFRPFASPNHQVTKGRYITSNDPRGYMSVYLLFSVRHFLLIHSQTSLRVPIEWSMDHDGHGRRIHPLDWNLEG